MPNVGTVIRKGRPSACCGMRWDRRRGRTSNGAHIDVKAAERAVLASARRSSYTLRSRSALVPRLACVWIAGGSRGVSRLGVTCPWPTAVRLAILLPRRRLPVQRARLRASPYAAARVDQPPSSWHRCCAFCPQRPRDADIRNRPGLLIFRYG